MKQLLTERHYHVDGTWYEPKKFLKSFKSVVRAEYLETTSSAGDWSGYILQKILGKFYLILFWQTNSFPYSGFDIDTDCRCYVFGNEPTKKECDEVMWADANL